MIVSFYFSERGYTAWYGSLYEGKSWVSSPGGHFFKIDKKYFFSMWIPWTRVLTHVKN